MLFFLLQWSLENLGTLKFTFGLNCMYYYIIRKKNKDHLKHSTVSKNKKTLAKIFVWIIISTKTIFSKRPNSKS